MFGWLKKKRKTTPAEASVTEKRSAQDQEASNSAAEQAVAPSRQRAGVQAKRRTSATNPATKRKGALPAHPKGRASQGGARMAKQAVRRGRSQEAARARSQAARQGVSPGAKRGAAQGAKSARQQDRKQAQMRARQRRVKAKPRPAKKLCPACEDPLVAINYSGEAVQQCETCGGYWCPANTFSTMAQKPEGSLDRKLFVKLKVLAESRIAEEEGKPSRKKCPQCGHHLVAWHYKQILAISYERCENGCGTYVDRSTLEKIQVVEKMGL